MKTKMILIIAAFFSAVFIVEITQIHADPVTVHRREVEIIRVVDGDTFKVRPVEEITVRLSNADAWESRQTRRAGDTTPINLAELASGTKAKQEVEALLKLKRVWLETGSKDQDSFGRTLGKLIVVEESGKEMDLGEWLKAEGHTRK